MKQRNDPNIWFHEVRPGKWVAVNWRGHLAVALPICALLAFVLIPTLLIQHEKRAMTWMIISLLVGMAVNLWVILRLAKKHSTPFQAPSQMQRAPRNASQKAQRAASEKPFIAYRNGWMLSIQPRNAAGWKAFALWMLPLLAIIGLAVYLGALLERSGMSEAKAALIIIPSILVPTGIWAFAMVRWMMARADIIDVGK